jgi:pimeloyl-ACP methyl ester carboxylesterase/tetratricopeptide (TPR) repeat protein
MLSVLFRALCAIAVLAVPLQAQNHASHHQPTGGEVRLQKVQLRTGVELEVAEHGRLDGQPVLFLHGFTDSHFSYSRVLPHLPETIRAIVPTLRGHGESSKPACCYRLADFTRDVVALLDALQLERATIVGHSLGSFIGQRIAVEFPARVTNLVLIGSGYTPRIDLVVEFSKELATLTDPVPPEFARAFQQSTLAQPVPSDFFEQVVKESEKVPAAIWRAVINGLIADTSRVALEQIRANTLILSGKKDAYWGQVHYDSLAKAIPRARLIVYEASGHSPNWEEPARVASDLAAFLVPASLSSREAPGHDHPAPTTPGPITLLEGLGDWQMDVTTPSPEARRFFDQGLRLVYAFNYDEAVRSFERATDHDPGCAMCHWGMAYALGPNINLPMDASAEPRAVAAISRASRLKVKATARERALIDAMSARYGEPAGQARAARDSAYANQMRQVAKRFRSDADIQVIFADAMMNLRPWNQWTRMGQPQPGTLELVAALEGVLARRPDHAGACHVYVHAVEASNTPERALPCAERLPKLMPGAGHVVHMPAHVYLRIGRYEDAARANIAAVNADNRYFSSRAVPDGIYPMFYAPHNLHFLWATYLLSGQKTKALNTARTLQARVKPADARAVASLEGFLVSELLTLARFRDWEAILAMPQPPTELRYVRGMWHYARGLALAATGDSATARRELEQLRALATRIPADVIIILNPAPALLNLAADVLEGAIAQHARQYDVAVKFFRAAVQKEDALTYDEPPPWYHSVRNVLGEALLEAGRAADAEQAFREDLRFVRETGWSLDGLERSLRAQGKKTEADALAERLSKAWQYADGPLPRAR